MIEIGPNAKEALELLFLFLMFSVVAWAMTRN